MQLSIANGKDHDITEVYVESLEYGIYGKIDGIVKIHEDEIVLEEYKLKPTYKEINDEYEGYVKQAISYALAFKAYFNYQGSLGLTIKRLTIDTYKIYTDLNAFPRIYERTTYHLDSFSEEVLLEKIMEIKGDITQIKLMLEKQIPYRSTQNPNKCRKCIYRKSCEKCLYNVAN